MEVWFRSFSFLFMGDGCRFQPLIFPGVVSGAMVVLGRVFCTSLDVLQRILRRTTSMFGEFAEQPTMKIHQWKFCTRKAENKRLEGKNEGLVMFGSDDVPLHFEVISGSSH